MAEDLGRHCGASRCARAPTRSPIARPASSSAIAAGVAPRWRCVWRSSVGAGVALWQATEAEQRRAEAQPRGQAEQRRVSTCCIRCLSESGATSSKTMIDRLGKIRQAIRDNNDEPQVEAVVAGPAGRALSRARSARRGAARRAGRDARAGRQHPRPERACAGSRADMPTPTSSRGALTTPIASSRWPRR